MVVLYLLVCLWPDISHVSADMVDDLEHRHS
jgi:hypothetical protein